MDNETDNITHNEMVFRNFIRSHQLTAKWHEFIKENPLEDKGGINKGLLPSYDELKECILNLMGVFDTPISRRKLDNEFINEVRVSGRKIIERLKK